MNEKTCYTNLHKKAHDTVIILHTSFKPSKNIYVTVYFHLYLIIFYVEQFDTLLTKLLKDCIDFFRVCFYFY